jgi:hypothetical protein
VIEVHLGVVPGTHGIEEATPTQIDLRLDNYGNAFEKDVSVSVINHALVAPLAQLGVKRQDSSLFFASDILDPRR